MKYKILLVCACVIYFGGIVTGYFLFDKSGNIKIKEIIKPITVWKEKPESMTQAELLRCAKSKISISAKPLGDYEIDIEAFDDCKYASAKYKITQIGPPKKHIIIGSYGVIKLNGDLHKYYSVKYHRIFGTFNIGGEVIVVDKSNYGAGASIGFYF